jgi:hypothetical protein
MEIPRNITQPELTPEEGVVARNLALIDGLDVEEQATVDCYWANPDDPEDDQTGTIVDAPQLGTKEESVLKGVLYGVQAEGMGTFNTDPDTAETAWQGVLKSGKPVWVIKKTIRLRTNSPQSQRQFEFYATNRMPQGLADLLEARKEHEQFYGHLDSEKSSNPYTR